MYKLRFQQEYEHGVLRNNVHKCRYELERNAGF
jgi:hypothetical protein